MKRLIDNTSKMNKRKVLVVATSRKTRGGITSVVKAHEKGPQWKEFHCHWVQTHRDGPSWRKIAYFISGLFDFLIRIPFYDIVHIHFSNGNSMRRKLIFARMAKRMRKKIIIHFHAFDPDTTIHGKDTNLYGQLFRMADGIIVLSNWWRDEVIKAFPGIGHRVYVLYNPCEEIQLVHTNSTNPQILYAGTVNSRKGYEDLIKAFSIIAPNHPTWTISIAGNGEIENGRKIAQELGISAQVEFLGWVTGEAKHRVFQEASIFCLPSYAEGFPMAVLDAWAYGLPVVTTPVGGIPDIAKEGDNMLLFNPGDTDNLAKQLERLITDLTLRKHIAEESEKLAHGLFSINTINLQLAEIYRTI